MIEKINGWAEAGKTWGAEKTQNSLVKNSVDTRLTNLLVSSIQGSGYKALFQNVMAGSDAIGRCAGNWLGSGLAVAAEQVVGSLAAPLAPLTQIALRTSALALGVVAASLTVGAVAVKELSAWSWNKIKTGCTILAQQAARAWDAVKSKLIEIGKALGNAFVKTAKFLGAVIALALLAGVATITDAIKFTIGLLSFLYRTIQWNFGGGKKELSDLRLETQATNRALKLLENASERRLTNVVSRLHSTAAAQEIRDTTGDAMVMNNTDYWRKRTDLINKKAPLATLPQRIRETSSVYAVFKNFQKGMDFQTDLKNSFQDCFRLNTNAYRSTIQGRRVLRPASTGGHLMTRIPVLADSSSMSSLSHPMMSEDEVSQTSLRAAASSVTVLGSKPAASAASAAASESKGE